MHAHATLIETFYTSFQRRDAASMGACYHPEVHFSDPVFGDLHGASARAMWAMLCDRGQDLRITYGAVDAGDDQGQAHWEAWYTFSATGRAVHNRIDARFTFADGLIHTHHDTFDLWRWSAQALGLRGQLLGWAPPVRRALRSRAQQSLQVYMDRQRPPN